MRIRRSQEYTVNYLQITEDGNFETSKVHYSEKSLFTAVLYRNQIKSNHYSQKSLFTEVTIHRSHYLQESQSLEMTQKSRQSKTRSTEIMGLRTAQLQ
jgi:hypothetical protein